MHLLATSLAVAPAATVGLLVLLLWAIGLTADRAFVVARSRLSGHGRPFIERLVALVEAGQIDEALAACSRTRAILPDIGLIVLRTRLREERDLEAVVEAAVRSTTPKLSRRLRYLPAIAVSQVLLGAGGTLAAAMRQGQGAGLHGESLAPLAAAAFLAVLPVVAHAFLANQIDAIQAQVGEFSRRLANALLDRPDVRLGHR